MDELSSKNVDLTLSQAEALVLFELLARFIQDGQLRVDDPAEEQTLANVFCDLESRLVEPFLSNYLELLEAARSTLRPSSD
jgi:hypothetical protein